MKCLSKDEANLLLDSNGMVLGDWNRIVDLNRQNKKNDFFINYQAPRDALHLYCFSQHVAGWLPSGNWKIFQIDDSTSLAPDEAFLLARLLYGTADAPNFLRDRTFVFEFGDDEDANVKVEMVIANLIYVFLLFECHGYVVSSASQSGEILGVQDGFIYFISRDRHISGAQELISEFEKNPVKTPKWICDLAS